MSTFLYALLAVLVLGVASFVFGRVVRAYLKFRGTRLVTCPENKKTAAVEVNAREAAWKAVLGQSGVHFHLKECSRWPKRRDCGQECLAQIAESPEECLLKKILEKWYQGQTCVLCGNPFEEIHWYEHKPGLLSPEGQAARWREFRPEDIPGVLSTYLPVCWDCRVAETFRREHPELVVDRRWSPKERARMSRK